MNYFKFLMQAATHGLPTLKPRAMPAPYQAPVQEQSSGPLTPATDGDFELIRYAATPEGILSRRDPEVLRRFVLDSADEAEQTRRQIQLFKCASIRLSCLPQSLGRVASNRGGSQTEVVNCGLFAIPILLRLGHQKRILKRLPLDHRIQMSLAKSLEAQLAKLGATPISYARVESLIAVAELNSISPLQVQSATSNETRRMAGVLEPVEVTIPESMRSKEFDSYRRHQGGWSLRLPQVADVWTECGPDQPLPFLLICYFAWDAGLPEPKFTHAEGAIQTLTSLLEGYLTTDKCSALGELGCQASPERVRVWVDSPLLMQDALTRAQVMHFRALSKIAKKSNRRFELGRVQSGSIQHWTASVLPQHGQRGAKVQFGNGALGIVPGTGANDELFDEPTAVIIEQAYDSLWRPKRHVQDIEYQVMPELRGFRGSVQQGDEDTQNDLHCDEPADQGESRELTDAGVDETQASKGNVADATNDDDLEGRPADGLLH